MPERRRLASILLLLAGSFAWGGASQAAGAEPSNPGASSSAQPRYAGRPLEEALRDLRAHGLRLLYSSRLVRPEMRIEREPAGGDPRSILEELLAAHGLGLRSGPDGLLIVVPRPLPPPPPTAEPASPEPAATFREEIVVTPSRFSLLDAGPAAPLGLSRDEILALPHLGDDLARALVFVPGIAANDVSARFHVRGGRRDETEIMLDGQELFDPFHLRDFDGALTFVPPAVLSGAALSSGAFPARHGGRMSGVLEMTSAVPQSRARGRIGAGILGAQLGGEGPLPGRRGGWMAEARRGSGDLLGRLLQMENPEYWDAFGKVEVELGPRQELRANLLHSADRLSFAEVRDGESKRWLTDYDDSYLWLTHQMLLGSSLLLESAASTAHIDRDRSGREDEEEARFAIRDRRDSTVRELRQEWSALAGGRHELRAGWRFRDSRTDYDYLGTRVLDDPLARLRHDFGREATTFAGRFEARDRSLYLSDAMRLRESLTLELGLRYDREPLAQEEGWSPRVNLAWALGERSVARLGWGVFRQSQRTSELQVEDGETAFHRGERSEHWVLGLDRALDFGAGRRWDLRVELYQRTAAQPRPRYENLFEPLNVFPEIEPDRVRTAPESSRARGAELFLRGPISRSASLWFGYTWAETQDRIDGRQVPRLFDQRHSLDLDLDLRAGANWRLNLAWRFHTGWPTTPLSLRTIVDEEGEEEVVPQLGPLNSRRLPPYHRLDLRASRRFRLRSIEVEFFVDVQNVYGRRNVGGSDFQVDEESGALQRKPELWPGILPSLGFTLEL